MRHILIVAIAAFFLSFGAFHTFAVSPAFSDDQIPDVNGTYNVAGHPNLKVRVFVHYPRSQQNALVACSADNNSTAVDGVTGWHLPSTWNYELNLSSAPNGINLQTVANNAFTTWHNATNMVTVNYLGNTSISRKALDGHNVITWGRTSGSALATTYTWYDTTTNTVVENDTIFNKKFAWTWSANTCDANRYDAQDILTHETGHWYGLDDEYASNYADNTMYGYGAKGEIKKDTLTQGDVDGITSIYH